MSSARSRCSCQDLPWCRSLNRCVSGRSAHNHRAMAAEGDTDAPIDDTTAHGAPDLHYRLPSSPSFGGCRTCHTSRLADR
jgi:hypothetical protein